MNSTKFGNSVVRYKIRRSNRRKTSEIVVSKSGVDIITPKTKSDIKINHLVQKHVRWIYQKKLKVKEEKRTKISFQNGSQLPYLGKYYQLVVVHVKEDDSFRLEKTKFVVKVTKLSKNRVRNMYYHWTKQMALPILKKEVSKYARKLNVPINDIAVKNHKSKWGSISKNGKMNFNQNLIRAPIKIIDYVVAHEVCHLKIPNHSSEFWELLYSIMPDYQERKDWLRINRTLLTNN